MSAYFSESKWLSLHLVKASYVLTCVYIAELRQILPAKGVVPDRQQGTYSPGPVNKVLRPVPLTENPREGRRQRSTGGKKRKHTKLGPLLGGVVHPEWSLVWLPDQRLSPQARLVVFGGFSRQNLLAFWCSVVFPGKVPPWVVKGSSGSKRLRLPGRRGVPAAPLGSHGCLLAPKTSRLVCRVKGGERGRMKAP